MFNRKKTKVSKAISAARYTTGCIVVERQNECHETIQTRVKKTTLVKRYQEVNAEG